MAALEPLGPAGLSYGGKSRSSPPSPHLAPGSSLGLLLKP